MPAVCIASRLRSTAASLAGASRSVSAVISRLKVESRACAGKLIISKRVIVSVSFDFAFNRLPAFPLVAGKGGLVRRRLLAMSASRWSGVSGPARRG
ncbi:hypothetical protein ASE60_12765 [Ensifer sp. Root278]|nr:hypothetical protein ASE60_12765 [Ensifer sp. Root278]